MPEGMERIPTIAIGKSAKLETAWCASIESVGCKAGQMA
jgi:hypothetical protein